MSSPIYKVGILVFVLCGMVLLVNSPAFLSHLMFSLEPLRAEPSGAQQQVTQLKEEVQILKVRLTAALAECQCPQCTNAPSAPTSVPVLTTPPVQRNDLQGVFPLMRHWGLGQGNLETPAVLLQPGNGRVVVDVGLSANPKETIDAMEHGFNVIGFELVPSNFQTIRRTHGSHERVHIVKLIQVDGKWRMPPDVLLPPPVNAKGQGSAYIVNAGCAAHDGSTSVSGGGTGAQVGGGAGDTPLVALDDILPQWVNKVFMLKIDTQGFEAQVLAGAQKSLERTRFEYVQYELSPKLMANTNSGDPLELLKIAPSHGGICFDMMGEHNKMPRPSAPLDAYLQGLNNVNTDGCPEVWVARGHSQQEANRVCTGSANGFGMWDDILCYFPGTGFEDVAEMQKPKNGGGKN